MRCWRRRGQRGALLVVLMLGLAGAGGSRPAGAGALDVDRLEGGAFGLTVSLGTLGTPAPPSPVVSGSAAEPEDAYGPLFMAMPTIGIPGLLSVGPSSVQSQGRGVAPEDPAATVTSQANVGRVDVLPGLLAATGISTSCAANGFGVNGATMLINGAAGAAPLSTAPAPNTRLDLAGVSMILNEQIVETAGGVAGITVNGAHIRLDLTAVVPGLAADIVIAQSRCRAEGPGVGPGPVPPPVPPDPDGPSGPDGPTGPDSPGTSVPSPGPGPFPPTTIGGPTTTLAGGPTTTGPPGPGPTTTTRPGGPGGGSAGGSTGNAGGTPGSVASLIVVSVTGQRSGPPGVSLTVAGTGYGQCDRVYFFFDGDRIGAAEPDAEGNVGISDLSVPGEMEPGQHVVTASCQASGDRVVQSTTFEVLDADVHRSGLVTAIPHPRDVDTSPATLAVNAAAAVGLVMLIAFPFALFNKTLEENYHEVRGWFGLRPKDETRAPPGPVQIALLLLMVGVGGLLCALLAPNFKLDRTGWALVLGMAIALLITGIGFSIPSVVYMRRREQEWGRVRVLLGSILVAAATVGLSRLLDFRPGYAYGLLAVFVFQRQLELRRQGRLAALTALIVFLVTLTAWMARSPVADIAARPGAAFGVIMLEAVLAGVFLLGLESLLVNLLPIRFLDGQKMLSWNRLAWAALFAAGLFAFFEVLLSPGSGYVGYSRDTSFVLVMALYIGFGLFSVAFWAYFRFRPARDPDQPALV